MLTVSDLVNVSEAEPVSEEARVSDTDPVLLTDADLVVEMLPVGVVDSDRDAVADKDRLEVCVNEGDELVEIDADGVTVMDTVVLDDSEVDGDRLTVPVGVADGVGDGDTMLAFTATTTPSFVDTYKAPTPIAGVNTVDIVDGVDTRCFQVRLPLGVTAYTNESSPPTKIVPSAASAGVDSPAEVRLSFQTEGRVLAR